MRRGAGALLATLLLAGCGGGAKPAGRASGRPLSSSQQLELARALLGDYERSGSRLAGTYKVQGQLLQFSGSIDFRRGRGTLSLSEGGQVARRFYWTRTVVLAQSAPGSSEYLAARPDPQRNVVHHLISFFDLLSSPVIGNIELLQSTGVRYLGSADGSDEFREGPRTYISVTRATGLLSAVRVDEATGGVIAVTLLSHGPQQIAFPPRSAWRQQAG